MIFEVCCGSLDDCISAYKAKADRIELNSALYLGGLTPSLSTLLEAKKEVTIPIICMVRPRGDGFIYSENDYRVILSDAKLLLENGADGLAFGFLNKDYSVDKNRSKEMVDLIHKYNKEAVFHMAIDLVDDIDKEVETLIEIGVDRILTKGQAKSALEGLETIKRLNGKYSSKIQILPGAGISHENAKKIIEETGVNQVHASCKTYIKDPSGKNKDVDFTYTYLGYEVSDINKIKKLREVLK